MINNERIWNYMMPFIKTFIQFHKSSGLQTLAFWLKLLKVI